METLSHWDSADEFTGQAAAALVLGIEPNSLGSSVTEQNRVNVVCDRMALDYERALKRLYHEAFNIYPEVPQEIYSNSAHELQSVKLKNLYTLWTTNEEDCALNDWLINDHASAFETQNFCRETIADWLDAIQLKSAYEFKKSAAYTKDELDPSDRPEELDAAILAHQRVLNGYGNPTATFRNRIVTYLKEYYPHMKPDAIDRIATVANPDKSTGRKKINSNRPGI